MPKGIVSFERWQCPCCNSATFTLNVRPKGTIYAKCLHCGAVFNMTKRIRVA